MLIISPNLRHTTREHHKPFRSYILAPKGGVPIRIEKKLPTDERGVPKLWS